MEFIHDKNKDSNDLFQIVMGTLHIVTPVWKNYNHGYN